MPVFATLIDLTDAEFQNAQEFVSMWGRVRNEVEEIGVNIRETYALLTDHDLLVIFEAADVDIALQTSLAMRRHGLNVDTMAAVPFEHIADFVDDSSSYSQG